MMSDNAPSPPPDVPSAPAPWTLTGDGYIVMLELPEAQRRAQSFIPDASAGASKGGIAC